MPHVQLVRFAAVLAVLVAGESRFLAFDSLLTSNWRIPPTNYRIQCSPSPDEVRLLKL
jgi:hypothetical protein